jgi:outer membrane usher protein FimD/PapC
MNFYVALGLCACLIPSNALAQVGRRGGGQRAVVQNRSTNVNRNYNTNVNRNVNVNQNINVNRNVNVNTNYHGGCYNCGYYHDNSWNWGSFAAGAAVGVATTAVVAAATRPASSTTVVVQAPALGTVIPTLPGGCATVASGGAVIYNCSNVYYRPYYQGTQLVYQVVTYP